MLLFLKLVGGTTAFNTHCNEVLKIVKLFRRQKLEFDFTRLTTLYMNL